MSVGRLPMRLIAEAGGKHAAVAFDDGRPPVAGSDIGGADERGRQRPVVAGAGKIFLVGAHGEHDHLARDVEMLGVELYDAQTGEKLGKIDRMVATVRIEDLYALNLQRNINLKDLQIEGLELWVNFDAQGQSNFRNLRMPPPEPNQRILFAYSTAHIDVKNALIHYGDALHSLSGEARNLRATIQPDDPNAPAESWMNTVTLSATNSTLAYDGRPITLPGDTSQVLDPSDSAPSRSASSTRRSTIARSPARRRAPPS